MLHKNASLLQRHAPHNWVVANTAALNALAVLSEDIGKIAWQTDNDSFWVLKSVGPSVWVPSGGAPAVLPTATDLIKGGVKIGARLTMTGEVLSADIQSSGGGLLAGQVVMQNTSVAPSGMSIDTRIKTLLPPVLINNAPIQLSDSVSICKLADNRIYIGSFQADLAYIGTVGVDKNITWVSSTPPPISGTRFSITLLSDGRLLMLGASNTYIGTVSGNNITWVNAGGVPVDGLGYSVLLTLSDGRVISLGGNIFGAVTGNTYIGSVSGNTVTWVTSTAMPSTRWNMAAAILANGRILVIGGENTNDYNTIWNGLVSGNTITWSTSSTPVPNAIHGSILVPLPDGDCYYGYGFGYNGVGFVPMAYLVKTGYASAATSSNFIPLFPINTYRYRTYGVLIGASIFILGGMDASGAHTNVCSVVDILFGFKKL